MTIQWKTTTVMNDLAEAAQIVAAAVFVVVKVTIDWPSSTKTKTQKKDRATTTSTTSIH